MNSFISMIPLGFCIIWIIHTKSVVAQTSDAELSGPDVCFRTVTGWEYTTKNESYVCGQRVEVDCGYISRWPCYEYQRTICWREMTYCEYVRKVITFCCKGFQEDGYGGCQKAVMCEKNNGGCDQVCKQDGTQQKCDCYAGYVYDRDGQTCEDVDECAVNNGGCSHRCDNSPGSFYCSCPYGYMLNNQLDCKEIDECEMFKGICEHDCHNVDGSFYCTCKQGFVLKEGSMCEDRDECDPEEHYDHGCELCVNDHPSYHCECPEGKIKITDTNQCACPTGKVLMSDGRCGTVPRSTTTSLPDATFFNTERQVGASVAPLSGECPTTCRDGAIAGGVIGVLILLILVAAVVFLLWRRGCFNSPAKAAAPPAAAENMYDNTKVKPEIQFDNEGYGNMPFSSPNPTAPPEPTYDNLGVNVGQQKPDQDGIYDNI